jgi:hypothetical protein
MLEGYFFLIIPLFSVITNFEVGWTGGEVATAAEGKIEGFCLGPPP